MNISYIVSISCMVICIIMFFYFKWYIKKHISGAGLISEYRSEVHKLIVDINSATDRDSQLVEDRILKLKAILEDTDKRISVYVKELEKSRTGEALYTSLGRGIRAALNVPPEAAGVLAQQGSPVENTGAKTEKSNHVQPSLLPMDGIFDSIEIGQADRPPPQTAPAPLSLDEALATNPPPPQREDMPLSKPPSKRQIRAHIDLLITEGLAPEEIAERLSISLAEVNLAMNLRRPKH